jgi:hypothetical protein
MFRNTRTFRLRKRKGKTKEQKDIRNQNAIKFRVGNKTQKKNNTAKADLQLTRFDLHS